MVLNTHTLRQTQLTFSNGKSPLCTDALIDKRTLRAKYLKASQEAADPSHQEVPIKTSSLTQAALGQHELHLDKPSEQHSAPEEKSPEPAPELVSLDTLLAHRIVDDRERIIGKLADLTIDLRSWQVTYLAVALHSDARKRLHAVSSGHIAKIEPADASIQLSLHSEEIARCPKWKRLPFPIDPEQASEFDRDYAKIHYGAIA